METVSKYRSYPVEAHIFIKKCEVERGVKVCYTIEEMTIWLH